MLLVSICVEIQCRFVRNFDSLEKYSRLLLLWLTEHLICIICHQLKDSTNVLINTTQMLCVLCIPCVLKLFTVLNTGFIFLKKIQSISSNNWIGRSKMKIFQNGGMWLAREQFSKTKLLIRSSYIKWPYYLFDLTEIKTSYCSLDQNETLSFLWKCHILWFAFLFHLFLTIFAENMCFILLYIMLL